MKPIHTIGIDIGSGAVKSVLFAFDEQGNPSWLAKRCERIRRRAAGFAQPTEKETRHLPQRIEAQAARHDRVALKMAAKKP